jgi:hypothetical protein
MKSCRSFQTLLPIYSGGELTEAEHQSVELHLARCTACRDEEATFSQVIDIAKNASLSEYRIPSIVRNRIALSAAERVSRRPWGLSVPMFSLSARPGLLAAAAVVVLTLVALPVTQRQGSGPASQPDVAVLDITSDGGVVKLAWSDGSRDSYRVYKSTDPRVMGQSEVHVVRGHAWTDTRPESAAIVYYRID